MHNYSYNRSYCCEQQSISENLQSRRYINITLMIIYSIL